MRKEANRLSIAAPPPHVWAYMVRNVRSARPFDQLFSKNFNSLGTRPRQRRVARWIRWIQASACRCQLSPRRCALEERQVLRDFSEASGRCRPAPRCWGLYGPEVPVRKT